MDEYRSIVITGGGGMLACALVDALKRRGLEPVAVGREACDITQPDQVQRLFERYRPSLVLNCAAHTEVDQAENEPAKAHAINAEGPATLARACCMYQSKLVHYSTDFVFDGLLNRPYRPDDKTNPLSVYGKSKLAGEENIKLIAPQSSLIIRTSWLFGEHGNCFPQTIVKLAKMNRQLRIVADQLGSPTYTHDLADGTFHLIDAKARGVIHVTNSGITSWYQFAAAVLEEFGLAADMGPVTTAQWLEMRPKQAQRPAFSALNCDVFNDLVGYPMREWSLALHSYCQNVANHKDNLITPH